MMRANISDGLRNHLNSGPKSPLVIALHATKASIKTFTDAGRHPPKLLLEILACRKALVTNYEARRCLKPTSPKRGPYTLKIRDLTSQVLAAENAYRAELEGIVNDTYIATGRDLAAGADIETRQHHSIAAE